MVLRLNRKRSWDQDYWSADGETWFRSRREAREHASQHYTGEVRARYGAASEYRWADGSVSHQYA